MRSPRIAVALGLFLSLLAVAPARAYVTVGGTIGTSTTWGRTAPAADGIYWVTSNVTVSNGATLTIEPGVIVKLGAYAITVGGTGGGSLVAIGTAAERVVFTSIKDDLRADTNGDGTATAPAAGDWGRVYFTTGGGGSLSDVDVLYAGRTNSHAIYCATSAPSELRNASLRKSSGIGLQCAAGYCPAVIENTVFADNGTWPVRLVARDAAKIAGDNVFTGNRNQGVYVDAGSLTSEVHAWAALTVPWFVDGTLTIPTGATLDLAAGLVLKMDLGASVTVSGGVLNTLGVAGQPVLITSARDDAALGDTNGDGTATVPARGDWARLRYTTGGGGALDGVEVRYAGSTNAYGIHCESAAPSRLVGSTIRQTNGTGLFCGSGYCPGTVSGNAFVDGNGWPIRLYPRDASKIAGDNLFSGNKYQGVFVYGTSLTAGAHAWAVLPVPWYLEGTVTVPAGATLDLPAGIVVKLDLGASLYIDGGVLNTHGVAGNPVLVTSYRDDAALGDTNADGTATVPARGNWGRLYYTDAGTGALDGAEIRYAGNSTSVGIYCNTGGPSRIAGSTLRLINGTALFCESGYCPATVSGNTFVDNSLWPIRMYPVDAPKIAADNVFTGNQRQGVLLYHQVLPAGSYALSALSVAWYLEGGIAIPAGAALELAAGAVLKVGYGSSISISGGLLNALGTAERAVLITSERDDAALGDTNGDGTATLPAPGNWARLYYTGGGDAGTLGHAEVRYGGSGTGVAIHCYTGCFAAIDSSIVRDNNGSGIRVDWAGTSPTITRCKIRGNDRGVVVAGTASPLIGGASGQGNDILANVEYGVENTGSACINARFNYWGSESGPNDPSAASDTCGLGSLAGAGDKVSNNVDYTGYVGSPSAPPEPPVALSPPSPSESTTDRPTLTVQNSPSPGTLKYRFQVARNVRFDLGLQEQLVDPGAGTTAWTVPAALTENATHYWRCRVEDQATALPSSWTEIWRFFVSTTDDPPNAPSPKSPVSGSRVETATPTLVVYDATDPDDNELRDSPLTYEFAVYSDAGLTQPVEQQAGIAETPAETAYTVVTTLAENTEYWWRARANDAVQDGAWSATRRFFVNTVNDAGPESPTLSSPADGASVETVQPQLRVDNPLDVDRDPLVFTFEVFVAPELTGRVASTNSVAGPCCSGTTNWTVSPALERSRWHWWTSSARDPEFSGPDMSPAASLFTVGFPMPEPGAFGYLPTAGGDETRGDRVAYTTGGASGDVFVAYEVYNVPAGQESSLRVVVNGTDVGSQGAPCPGAWSSSRSVLVPDAVFSNSATNRVQFANVLNAPGAPAVEWGVRNVRMDVPPPVPVAARAWDTVVDVSWVPRDGIAGYNVYRAASAGGPYTRLNGALVSGNLYRDLGLANDVPYYYVVRSVSGTAVEGSDSNEVSATPSTANGVTPVTDLRVTRQGNDLRLAWTDVTTTGGVLHYRVYSVDPASTPPFTRTGAPILGTPAASPFDHAGAALGATLYWYDVATVNGGGTEAEW